MSPPRLSADRATAEYTVTLSKYPDSTAAVTAMKNQVRPAAHAAAPAGTYALVGGTTAVFADIQRAVNHDYLQVFPVAAALILVMLALMLRSLVAPWYLMASVGLGFGAALGASVLFFQVLRGESGLVFLIPVYIYVFVVALGTDYNILITARLREEASEGRQPRWPCAMLGRRLGRPDPDRHVRVADARREQHPVPARLRGSRRNRPGRVRDGYIRHPQHHRADRPRGLVPGDLARDGHQDRPGSG